MNRTLYHLSHGLFALAALSNLLAQVRPLETVNMISKILLMPALALLFIFSGGKRLGGLFYPALAALLFSWFGDVFLLYQNGKSVFFMLGLLAFLLAHLLYIYLFRRCRHAAAAEVPRVFLYSRIVFLVFAGSFLYTLLFPHLGDLRLPVALYTAVIIAMAITALLRKERSSGKSFLLVYGGALLFVLSDSLLAIDRFHSPVQLGGLLIMGSYILAQYLIVSGLVAHIQDAPAQERS
jgi:uncharacterized membrane protein YhhN